MRLYEFKIRANLSGFPKDDVTGEVSLMASFVKTDISVSEARNIVKERSFSFAVAVVNLYRLLTETKREFVMSKQLLRSGTALGAMVREAENAESKADFIHKLGIAQKECAESIYWMDLLIATNYLVITESGNLLGEAREILNMLKSSIITAKKNLANSRTIRDK